MQMVVMVVLLVMLVVVYGGNGQLVLVVISMMMVVQVQSQINYMCEYEWEVDCIGFVLFEQVGFDNCVMVGFFECL